MMREAEDVFLQTSTSDGREMNNDPAIPISNALNFILSNRRETSVRPDTLCATVKPEPSHLDERAAF
jgi:hypothetical protein